MVQCSDFEITSSQIDKCQKFDRFCSSKTDFNVILTDKMPMSTDQKTSSNETGFLSNKRQKK